MKLFPTQIHFEELAPQSTRKSLDRELLKECQQIRDYDIEGKTWSKTNYFGGYTSYGSLSELHKMSSTFGRLAKLVDRHVHAYAKTLDIDEKAAPLEMTNLWINMMPKGVTHSLHLHPCATISGTYYLSVPSGSSAIKFEDPRLACFMGSAPRVAKARAENKRFISLQPKSGKVVLFESWLRHEVETNQVDAERVSLSFNYNWF